MAFFKGYAGNSNNGSENEWGYVLSSDNEVLMDCIG